MPRFPYILLLLLATVHPSRAQSPAELFQGEILPVLNTFCMDCHDPDDSKGDVLFLQSGEIGGMQAMRSVWRSVAVQLRNRTMPPPKKKNQPSGEERARVAAWIDQQLAATACDGGPYAGQVKPRRLNRLEYNNTVRDLFGVDLGFDETLPMEGGTGEGFDNSGDALFIPPILLERFLEGAQSIVDAAILSPRLEHRYTADDLTTVKGAAEHSVLFPVYVEDRYTLRVEGTAGKPGVLRLALDGVTTHKRKIEPDDQGGFSRNFGLRLARGTHALSLSSELPLNYSSLVIRREKGSAPDEAVKRNHRRLCGLAPGAITKRPRELAHQQVEKLLPLAFRRPVRPDEVKRFMKLVERALDRGDPYEEALKLACRGILVSPEFLFRMEADPDGKEMVPLSDHELAVRLSYFLWSTMPDDTLRALAEAGKLQDDQVLAAQVHRMLDDPRARVSIKAFTGQWLGTRDVGGRVAPTANDVQKFYTPEVATDMRNEAVEYMHHILRANRSLLELIDSDYAFLTGRLAGFYEMPEAKELPEDEFSQVKLENRRRGGVLGMGGVLALTSHHKRNSPVLRGAWVFDTLIGEPVPPPPPDIPPLTKSKKKKDDTGRMMLERHRAHASCMACHNLIDPIGFALENFDWVGRWRDEDQGPIDTRGTLPTGESFDGPGELKRVLVTHKRDAFIRSFSRKLLAYALGRSLDDRDDCLIETLGRELEAGDFKARTLVTGIVLSPQFRRRGGS